MKIETPYLLFLGSATDHLTVKIANSIVDWRPDSILHRCGRRQRQTIGFGATMKTLPAGFDRYPVLLLTIALVLGACGGETAPEGVVARSDYGDTTFDDLESYILSLPQNRRQPAEDQDLADWRREILEEMLVTRRLTEEADEKGGLGDWPSGYLP